MRIGILETGRTPPDLIGAYGSYADMIRGLLTSADPGLEFVVYPVLEDQFPDSPDACDGWVITGSRHGVYENLPWMLRLQDLLRTLVAARRPVVGICFGHQILAQALGGRVEKSAKGWGVGIHEYPLTMVPPLLDGAPPALKLSAMHQDQVVELPPSATVVASSEFCPNAVLVYGDTALSFQGHPEFGIPFEADLVALRRGLIPEPLADAALADLKQESAKTDAAVAAEWMLRVLKHGQAA